MLLPCPNIVDIYLLYTRHMTSIFHSDSYLKNLPADPEYPFYTEAAFARKLRRRRLVTPPRNDEAGLYLALSEIEEAVAKADLSPKQVSVLSSRASGRAWTEIAKEHGCTRQAALQVCGRALKRIARELGRSPVSGLREVYKEEVARFSPRRMGRRR